jgi:spore germination cell wall hydrolase CwlJ-like protein
MRRLLTLALLLVAQPLWAQTYQEKVVAAVLLGEAWCQGRVGMVAVAEVIRQRSRERDLTPLQVVTQHKAFSCLNRTTPDRLVRRYQDEPAFAEALGVARVLCVEPHKLPGITNSANHFTRVDERPRWARGQRPVAVIRSHAFYRLKY